MASIQFTDVQGEAKEQTSLAKSSLRKTGNTLVPQTQRKNLSVTFDESNSSIKSNSSSVRGPKLDGSQEDGHQESPNSPEPWSRRPSTSSVNWSVYQNGVSTTSLTNTEPNHILRCLRSPDRASDREDIVDIVVVQLWHGGNLESPWQYYKADSSNLRAARDASSRDRPRKRSVSRESRSSALKGRLTLTRTLSSNSLAKSIPTKSPDVPDTRSSVLASEETAMANGRTEVNGRNDLEAKPQGKVNWLIDNSMLPVKMPNSRVLAFGFRPLKNNGHPSDFPFKYFARKLLEKLRDDKERQRYPTRSTILVGHHLGGIVVERALVKASKRKSDRDTILSSISGIVFLATPFLGSDTVADLIARQLGMFVEEEEPPFANIRTSSEALEKLQKQFIKRVGQLGIPFRCFYEMSSSLFGEELQQRLVSIPDPSSRLYASGGNPKPAATLLVGKTNGRMNGGDGLETDFMSIGRYSDPSDPNYLKVLGALLGFVETRRLLGEAANGNQDSLQRLIGENAKSNSNARIEQLLHKAVAKNKTLLVRILLDKWDADVNYEDPNGTRAIDLAIVGNNEEMVEALLTAGADTRTPNRHGDSALDTVENAYLTDCLDETVYKLFQGKPLIKGPGFSFTRSFKPKAFEEPSTSTLKASKSFQATLVQFYNDDQNLTEYRAVEQPTVFEILFGSGLRDGPLDDFDEDQDQRKRLVCKWYHLPANNMDWAERLISELGFDHAIPPWAEQRHYNQFPHSRFFEPTVKQRRKEGDRLAIAIFMPYLSYETRNGLQQMSKIIDEVNMQDDSIARVRILQTIREELQNTMYDTSTWDGSSDPGSDTTAPSTPRDNEGASDEDELTPKWTSLRRTSRSPEAEDSDFTNKERLEEDTDHSFTTTDTGYRNDSPDIVQEDQNRNLITAYLNHSRPLHIRRTLDQYHYYMLPSTKERDEKGQVFYRYQKRQRKEQKMDRKVLMVDQLWLWCVRERRGDGSYLDTVISCFPQAWDQGQMDRYNLLDFVKSRERSPVTCGLDLMALFLHRCSGLLSDHQAPSSFSIVEIFQSSISRIANRETECFTALRELTKNDNKKWDAKQKIEHLSPLFSIHREISLLEEIKDIQDEIDILLKLLDDQGSVIEQLPEMVQRRQWTSQGQRQLPSTFGKIYDSLLANEQEIKAMQRRADATKSAINNLLDLKQKQANSFEARSAREAEFQTARQGNIILVFTVVTIVFLPLSFMASFFALDISEFPKDGAGDQSWPLGDVSKYLFGIALGVSVFIILLAFALNEIKDFLSHIFNKFEQLVVFLAKRRMHQSDNDPQSSRPSEVYEKEDSSTDEDEY